MREKDLQLYGYDKQLNRFEDMKKHYVVCYDITSQSVRSKIARILETHGVRIQKSVFAITLSTGEVAKFQNKLKKLIKTDDVLLLLPVCANCHNQALYLGQHVPPVLVL